MPPDCVSCNPVCDLTGTFWTWEAAENVICVAACSRARLGNCFRITVRNPSRDRELGSPKSGVPNGRYVRWGGKDAASFGVAEGSGPEAFFSSLRDGDAEGEEAGSRASRTRWQYLRMFPSINHETAAR